MKGCCQSNQQNENVTLENYVACEICAMNPVCQPLKVNDSILSLADDYLNKRIFIQSGDVLFDKSEPTSAIYAVCTGTFKLSQELNGKEKVVGFRFPGELLGEDALFAKQYNYQVTAITDGAICEVSVDKLMSYSELVPNLQYSLMELLGKQHLFNYQTFQSLVAKHSAESLLAAFLLNITERCKAHYGTDTSINLPMSRDSIANFLGLRRETLSRLFSKFQKEGLIRVSAKKIELLAKNKLQQLANL